VIVIDVFRGRTTAYRACSALEVYRNLQFGLSQPIALPQVELPAANRSARLAVARQAIARPSVSTPQRVRLDLLTTGAALVPLGDLDSRANVVTGRAPPSPISLSRTLATLRLEAVSG